MWRDRLLARGDAGTTVIESSFALVLVMLLSLGVIEVALTLYSRNVVEASAHEGARAAIELGSDPGSAEVVAVRTVKRAAGGLVSDLAVRVRTLQLGPRRVVRVIVSGRLQPPGPLPAILPIRSVSTLTKEQPVP